MTRKLKSGGVVGERFGDELLELTNSKFSLDTSLPKTGES